MARICVIRQGYFSVDPRVRNEVDALVSAGHQVDVICLQHPDEKRYERLGQVTIRRLPISRARGGWIRYLFEYSAFMAIAAWVVSIRHLRKSYDVVQVNTLPDSLVFSALIPRLLGARVLLDLHEAMPEFVSTKYHIGSDHLFVRMTVRFEQAAIRFADFAITCTEPMRRAFIARGASPEKVQVVLGSFGLGLQAGLDPVDTERSKGRFILICHGTIEERYGLDTIVRAVSLLREEIPGLFLAIYGEGSYRGKLQALVRELGLEQQVSIAPGYVAMQDLLRAISAADAGVVAMKRDASRDLTLCNKMFDYIGLRKPAIVSRTTSVEEYFDDSCFRMFIAGDEKDLAQAIRDVYASPSLRRSLVEHASASASRYSWPRQRERYLQIMDAVIEAKDGVSPTLGSEEPRAAHQ